MNIASFLSRVRWPAAFIAGANGGLLGYLSGHDCPLWVAILAAWAQAMAIGWLAAPKSPPLAKAVDLVVAAPSDGAPSGDDFVLRMLAGAQLGDDVALRLPSGRWITGREARALSAFYAPDSDAGRGL